MSSLTYTAYVTRRLVKYSGVIFGSFFVLYTVITWGINAWIAAHPPYVPPDTRYGVLPKIQFPAKKFDKKNFTFEMPNDKFPTVDDKFRVYFVARPDTAFLALEQDKKTAADLGFKDEPKEVGYGIYEFTNSTSSLKLTMNVLDGSFHLKYPYETDQMLLNPEKVLSKDEALLEAKSYLGQADKLPTDLVGGLQKVSFWKIEYSGLKAVSSQSEANVTRVDFFRQDLESKYKIVTADVNSATVSVVLTGSSIQNRKAIEVNYRYSPIDRESFGTYPIKTVDQAVNDLKIGNYWPAYDSVGNSATIRKIYLAFFEPMNLTNYMQPVFVFEGDNNFVAYVSAVTDKYVK
ncbi:hypothetical protein KBC75_00975 [Candidatus Shapirobacteria bacterium]|nr:hypothetical protein [Candidatus Shapirobacteria bacterium]